MKKKEFPKDLNVVIATKEQALWQRIKENTLKEIQTLEDNLVLNRAILERANQETKDLKLSNQ